MNWRHSRDMTQLGCCFDLKLPDWCATRAAVLNYADPFVCISFGRVETFCRKSVSAPFHTGAVLRSLSCNRLGSRALLKASLASRGSNEGKWSMDITLNRGPVGTGTGTVGLPKVVLTV